MTGLASAVTEYAESVLSGQTVAGRRVRLACQRHMNDLAHGEERGLYFDEVTADKAIRFYPNVLRLAEGQFAGQPFTLQPSQKFIIGSLFGWKRWQPTGEPKDWPRRFTLAYIEMGKGNGKTPLIAGLGLRLLCADNEPGAEVYSAAVTREQAGVLFRDMIRMVEASPDLSSRLQIRVGNISCKALGSFARPVSREAKSLDAKRVHAALIDELHEHPDPEAVDKMRKGTKGRRQPLVVEITNSGYDLNSICWTHHEYSDKVLEGVFEDDEWFAYVCGLDVCEDCRAAGKQFPSEGCPDCDDWRDEAVWLKVAPLLGVTIQPEYLRKEVREAERMPSKAALTKRLNFCIWTEAKNPWLAMDIWNQGSEPFDEDNLVGLRCFGGLDLSSNLDLTAFVLLFPPQGDCKRWRVRTRFWFPADNLWERVARDHVPYDAWLSQGYIETTPSNVIDYDWIEAAIKADAGRFRIEAVGYDRWAAEQIYQHLAEEGILLVPINQGYAGVSASCKALERVVIGGLLWHGGNPVLTWNASNAIAIRDPAGNVRLDKSDPNKRIDGLAALVDAMAVACRAEEEPGESIYETRGLMVLGRR